MNSFVCASNYSHFRCWLSCYFNKWMQFLFLSIAAQRQTTPNGYHVSRDMNSPSQVDGGGGGDYKYGRFDASALHIAHALKQTELQKAYNKRREKPIDYYLVSGPFENIILCDIHNLFYLNLLLTTRLLSNRLVSPICMCVYWTDKFNGRVCYVFAVACCHI